MVECIVEDKAGGEFTIRSNNQLQLCFVYF
jgi:hypothetical protein